VNLRPRLQKFFAELRPNARRSKRDKELKPTRMEITPATPRASADGGIEDEDYGTGERPNEGILGGFFRRWRRRNVEATASTTASTATSSRPRPRPSSDESSSAFLLLPALLIALAVVAGLHWSALSGMERNNLEAAAAAVSTSSSSSSSPFTVFSPGQLLAASSTAAAAAADGGNESESEKASILVAFAGEVFDVGPHNKHYGPGGDYSHFAGRDATRAFVSGDFENDLVDKVDDLLSDADSVQSLEHWLSFYERHKDYKKVGVVGGGAFFDEEGRKKRARVDLERAVEGRNCKVKGE
jgi:Cytochrome b5-like Heme/Steroid binding domain